MQTQLSMVELRSDLELERKALAARDEFLSIASHELNTPLTPLKLQLQSLSRALEKRDLAALPPDRIKRIVSIFDQQVDKISRLVSDLLDVSRISSGQLDLKREMTDLAQVVRSVVTQYTPQLSGAKCSVQLDLKENVTGDWDASRIGQIVTNLVLNAAKYAPEKPITISVSANGQSAELLVEDQGPGISKEDVKKIFRRFERIGASTNLAGLGLGLYICKQVAEAHGGDIQVESTLGRGTKFSVVLPMKVI